MAFLMGLDMYSRRLFIISTRPEEKFARSVHGSCFDILNIPVTKIIRRPYGEIESEVFPWRYDGIVLTSSAGSSIFLEMAERHALDFHGPAYCIGDKTAEPLRKVGMEVIVPERRETDGLLEIIMEHRKIGSMLLLFRSGKGNPALKSGLERNGFSVNEVVCYNVEPLDNPEMKKQLERRENKGIIFTSSMEVTSFFKFNSPESVQGKKVFAIGNPTKKTLADHGIMVGEPTGRSDFNQLVSDIGKKFCTDSGEWI